MLQNFPYLQVRMFIEKEFGAESIMRLGEAVVKMQVEVIPTGSLPIDIALGVGDVPRGRVVEILRIGAP